MEIKKNSVAMIQYQLRNEAGELLEDAYENDPVALLQGQGNVIRGLDRALLGHSAGDEFEVSVPPEDAYGLRQDDQIQRVSKKYFANAKKLRPGMQTSLRTENGTRLVTVVKVGGKVIDVDTNHPLAGQGLSFKVRITEVRDATPQELSHRHAHADGHDHH
ncbi:MAG: peptidylprolyl isomerase [Pseudomonadales bacterium]|nr:peptidylprolyl isomerase [Pseudomonadales bacterium]